jgi:hypothetical protein
MIRELATIADGLKAGRAVEPVTVRTFLSWFGAQRRGWQIVHQIRVGKLAGATAGAGAIIEMIESKQTLLAGAR